IPGILFPGKRKQSVRSRFQMQSLTVAIQSQDVTLSDYPSIPLLTPLLGGVDIRFDGVVIEIRWSEVSTSTSHQRRTLRRLRNTLLPLSSRTLYFALVPVQ